MRTVVTALATLLCSFALSAAAPPVAPQENHAAAGDEVRAAEAAFAKAFADHDSAKFVSYLDENAVFLGGNHPLHGRKEVAAVWTKMVEAKKSPFSWGPETVVVSGDGTIGWSSGPVRDPEGRQIAIYTSIWRRQSDRSWKIIFDGPGCDVTPAAH